jgi:hypothetical protein
MPSGFLPNGDAALLAWSLNFSTLITATPTAFGLTAAQATAYAALHATYTTALAAVDPGVRTKAAVAAKNTARTNLKNSARLLAKLVEGTATVSNAQKITLGLNVRAIPTPTPIPGSAPGLDVLSSSGFTTKLRLHDSTSGSRRGKPPGVNGASVFSHVGPTAPTEMSGWTFEGNTGKTRLEIAFPGTLAAGTTVWFTAFWFNGAKQSGPTCAPVATNLPGGSVAMAA